MNSRLPFSTYVVVDRTQAGLILLPTIFQNFANIVFFTDWRFVATMPWASLLTLLFQ